MHTYVHMEPEDGIYDIYISLDDRSIYNKWL